MPSGPDSTVRGAQRYQQRQNVAFKGSLHETRFHVGLGGYGLFSAVDPNVQLAFLAAQGQVASLQSWKVQLYPLVLSTDFSNHTPVHAVVQHFANFVRSNGHRQRHWLTVEKAADVA